MKKNLFLLIFFSLLIAGCAHDNDDFYSAKTETISATCDTCAKAQLRSSVYGIYGEVLWPVSGDAYNAVELPIVYIYNYFAII